MIQASSGFKTGWKAERSGGKLQGSILSPVLVNAFISSLGEGVAAKVDFHTEP